MAEVEIIYPLMEYSRCYSRKTAKLLVDLIPAPSSLSYVTDEHSRRIPLSTPVSNLPTPITFHKYGLADKHCK